MSLAGDLDLAGAPRLVDALHAAGQVAQLVVVDLRELTFIDCSGVHAMVNASSQARREKRRLLLAHATGLVRRMFELTGTGDQVDFFDLCAPDVPAHTLLRSMSGTIAA